MIDWVAEKLSQIKSVGEAVVSGFVPDKIAQQRYNVCLECEEFDNGKCKECGCFMRAKVLFKEVGCPKGYWGTWRTNKVILVPPSKSKSP
jgi:hypothetical protein